MGNLGQELEICENCKYYTPSHYKNKGQCDLWWGYVKSDYECDDYEAKDLDA